MSGVFSIASHCVLQYLPEVVMQEQTGCAHFLAVSLVISIPPVFRSGSGDPKRYVRAAVAGVSV
jgi:hypothetical protein